MKTNIDLGQESLTCCPCEAISQTKAPEKYYPTMRIEMTGEGPDIPEEGTMTIRFKKVEETNSNRGEKSRYSCTLEAREIVSMTDESASASHSQRKDTEDALDALAKEKSKE